MVHADESGNARMERPDRAAWLRLDAGSARSIPHLNIKLHANSTRAVLVEWVERAKSSLSERLSTSGGKQPDAPTGPWGIPAVREPRHKGHGTRAEGYRQSHSYTSSSLGSVGV